MKNEEIINYVDFQAAFKEYLKPELEEKTQFNYFIETKQHKDIFEKLDELYKLYKDKKVPITQAYTFLLDGEWGTGKTTTINKWLEKQKDNTSTIKIDVFKSVHSHDFLKDVLYKVKQNLPCGKKIWFYFINWFCKNLWLVLLIITLIILMLCFHKQFNQPYEYWNNFLQIFLTTLVGFLAIKGILNTSISLQVQNELEYIAKSQNIILVLDEIDNIPNNVFNDFFNTFRTILNIQGIFYIILWDKNIINKHINRLYKKDFYTQFTIKYITHTIKLTTVVERFFEHHLDNFILNKNPYTEIYATYLNDNITEDILNQDYPLDKEDINPKNKNNQTKIRNIDLRRAKDYFKTSGLQDFNYIYQYNNTVQSNFNTLIFYFTYRYFCDPSSNSESVKNNIKNYVDLLKTTLTAKDVVGLFIVTSITLNYKNTYLANKEEKAILNLIIDAILEYEEMIFSPIWNDDINRKKECLNILATNDEITYNESRTFRFRYNVLPHNIDKNIDNIFNFFGYHIFSGFFIARSYKTFKEDDIIEMLNSDKDATIEILNRLAPKWHFFILKFFLKDNVPSNEKDIIPILKKFYTPNIITEIKKIDFGFTQIEITNKISDYINQICLLLNNN